MSEDPPVFARIAHALFVDIVGYSRTSTSRQASQIQRLNQAVSASPAYKAAREDAAVQPIPTGDGMVILYHNDVIAPARCAVDLTTALAGALPVRMGIHSGLVQPQRDIAGHENVVGEGINTAQRIMDFGDAGHILLSAQYAAWLQEVDEWRAHVHPLGEGTAKHGRIYQVYCLRGPGFGREDLPARLRRGTAPEVPAAPAPPRKVALLYKPRLQPDEGVLRALEQELRAAGHEVFVDHERKINAAWARAVEEPIRQADAVIAIVSPRALQSEMLEYEIETAHDQFTRTGKPALLPVIVGQDEPLEGPIAAALQSLPRFVWNGPQDDRKLLAALLSAVAEPLQPVRSEVKLEPVGGAVPPESPFYVRRTCDPELLQALEAKESILLVKGARQIGKTSLLGQGIRRARELERRCAITDFQKLNATQMVDEDRFYRLLAATLGRQLGFKYDFEGLWDEIFGPNLNLESFLRELLEAGPQPLVWFMDEVDKLFTAPFASDFFGLVRSWHNSRSTEPGGPWDRLTVVISYATEAHLFIQDLNQSPFNVGRKLELEDFNLQQTIDLNGRYGGPLKSYAECEALQALLSGQPFLTRRALDAVASGKQDLGALLRHAAADTGPFGDHLQRILASVSRLPEVAGFVKAVLAGTATPGGDAYYRLLSAGVIRQERDGRVTFRCEVYRIYLNRHLG